MKQILLFLIAIMIICLSGCVPSKQIKSSVSSSEPVTVPPINASQSQGEIVEQPESQPKEPVVTLPEDISVHINGVHIRVDPMMELLSIVQYLSGYAKLQNGMMTKIKTSYQDEINLYFGSYEEHAAIQYVAEVMEQFNFEKPPTACLYLEKDFTISKDYENSIFATYNPANMDYFRGVMEQFCVDTKFNDFYQAHEAFYREMIEKTSTMIPTWDVLQAMESYYGKSMAEYTLVLVPLFHSGGFGPTINRTDGYHVYSIIGPSSTNERIPLFGNEATIRDLLIHEFGHSFVSVADFDNPAMLHEVARSEYLMEPIRENMRLMDYLQWSVAYEELVLRAAVIDITVRSTGVPSDPLLQIERNQGFVYIDDVYQVLQEYSNNHEEYPTFDVFVPVITDYLLKKYSQP